MRECFAALLKSERRILIIGYRVIFHETGPVQSTDTDSRVANCRLGLAGLVDQVAPKFLIEECCVGSRSDVAEKVEKPSFLRRQISLAGVH